MPLDVVVVAFLYRADLGLEAKHFDTVFAQHTGGRRGGGKGGMGRSAVFGGDFCPVPGGEFLGAERADPTVGHRHGAGLLDDAFGKGFEHLGWSLR